MVKNTTAATTTGKIMPIIFSYVSTVSGNSVRVDLDGGDDGEALGRTGIRLSTV